MCKLNKVNSAVAFIADYIGLMDKINEAVRMKLYLIPPATLQDYGEIDILQVSNYIASKHEEDDMVGKVFNRILKEENSIDTISNFGIPYRGTMPENYSISSKTNEDENGLVVLNDSGVDDLVKGSKISRSNISISTALKYVSKKELYDEVLSNYTRELIIMKFDGRQMVGMPCNIENISVDSIVLTGDGKESGFNCFRISPSGKLQLYWFAKGTMTVLDNAFVVGKYLCRLLDDGTVRLEEKDSIELQKDNLGNVETVVLHKNFINTFLHLKAGTTTTMDEHGNFYKYNRLVF